GAGDAARARTLALHAIVIGAAAGVATSALLLAFGPWLYRFLGGSGAVLEEAVRYSGVLFIGSVLVWLLNSLASVLRGTGDMRTPSSVLFVAALLQIALGGALGLGLGPFPRLGMVGIALGTILATGAGVAFLFWWLGSGHGRLRLGWRGVALRGELFADILKVGALSCVSPVQSVLTILIFTGLVARLGIAPLAGYGIGQRLEFLLIPIAFGIGVASLPMVGMAIGGGDFQRARRVAWTAGLVSAFNLGLLGLVVAIAPDLWAGLFTDDREVLDYARQYLRWAGPGFAFFGLGVTLYFASQGSGHILGPVLAGTVRLVLVAGAGAWLVASDAQAWQLFALVSAGMVAYGLATVASIRLTPWRSREPASRQPARAQEVPSTAHVPSAQQLRSRFHRKAFP
ncbi:MAG TPA: MATE family efflux transporter, partial [Burkholderiales bacterium]|nr:MATE family efflux transporter [Burkholderiales bacterium]